MEQQNLVQLPVRMKIEEGAKGEVKVTVAVDGDNDADVESRVVRAYQQLKKDLGG